MREITFGFVKPHAYPDRKKIEAMIEEAGLKIIIRKDPYHFNRAIAELQYEMHIGKHFFEDLIKMILEGPTELLIIEGKDAVNELMTLSGATDPAEAEENTIRKIFGKDKGYNAFHRSDSKQSARREILIHFAVSELPEDVIKELIKYS